MTYGYHRVSDPAQHLDRGIKEISDFCRGSGMDLAKIYTDEISGKTFNRPRYNILKEDVLRAGDVLVVTEVDRLGRSKNETLAELRYFKNKSVRVMILEIPTTLQDFSGLDNSLARMMMETINNLLIEMYATFAQAEMEKRKKRQQEGIQAMKDRDEWFMYGRPAIMNIKKFEKEYKRVLDGSITPSKLMKELGMSKSTYYKYRSKL